MSENTVPDQSETTPQLSPNQMGVSIGEALQLFFKNYANFQGRSSRSAFWWPMLIIFVVTLALLLVLEHLGLDGEVIVGLLSIPLILPSYAVAVRRFHDTGRSGWWVLINFIPAFGNIVLFGFMTLKGDEGENRFGPALEAGKHVSEV